MLMSSIKVLKMELPTFKKVDDDESPPSPKQYYLNSKRDNMTVIEHYSHIEYVPTKKANTFERKTSFFSKNFGIEKYASVNDKKVNYTNRLYTFVEEIEQKLMTKYYNSLRTNHENEANLLGSIHLDVLGDIFTKKFYNISYIMLMKSLYLSIVSTDTKSEITKAEKIRSWLKTINKISEGSYGITFKTGINKIDDFFILKISKTHDVPLYHEFLVGNKLNELREKNLTPNFMYTYGLFNTGKFVMESTKLNNKTSHIVWSAENGPQDNYLVIENVKDAPTLSRTIKLKTLTIDSFMSIFLQLIYSLTIAHEKYDFTHWDLHDSNIIMREISESDVWFKYNTNGGVFYVKINGLIPTIIDYGFSTLKIDDITLMTNQYASSHYLGTSLIYADIYRILIASWFQLADKNYRTNQEQKLHKYLTELVAFFLSDGLTSKRAMLSDLDTYIQTRDNKIYKKLFFYRLPLSYKTANIYDYIKSVISLGRKYGLDESNVTISQQESLNVQPKLLSCESINCVSLVQLERDLTTFPKLDINYIDICYTDNKLVTNNKIISNMHQNAYKQLKELEVTLSQLTRDYLHENMIIVRFIDSAKDYNTIVASDKDILDKMAKFYYNLLYFWNAYGEVINLKHNMECIAKYGYTDEINSRLIDQLLSKYDRFFLYLNAAKLDNYRHNFVEKFARDASFIKYLKEDAHFREFYNQWGTIIDILKVKHSI